MSEHDDGYAAGWRNCAEEALRIVQSHMDRLEPGKRRAVRASLVNLEASLRNILIAQKALASLIDEGQEWGDYGPAKLNTPK